MSIVESQPVGQQPSPSAQAVIAAVAQVAEQSAAEPTSATGAQASTLGVHDVGQLPSQASPGSSAPLPQVAALTAT